MNVLVTGSSGLIGSEAVTYFYNLGHRVWGIDNNMRRDFFGADGDTTPNLVRLTEKCPAHRHFSRDIRDRAGMMGLIREFVPDLLIHCAAQPSHDLAARRPLDDFDVNALGTLNLLEACRLYAPESVFI